MPKIKGPKSKKLSAISIRIEDDLKAKGEAVFLRQSLSTSEAIRLLFLKAHDAQNISFLLQGSSENSELADLERQRENKKNR